MDPKNIQTPQVQNPGTTGQTPPRGAFIHIPSDGKLVAELSGITPLELYAALSLIVEKLRKDFELK